MGDRVAPVAPEIARRQFDPRRCQPAHILGGQNQTIETGGVLVANKVRIEGEVQFVRQEE